MTGTEVGGEEGLRTVKGTANSCNPPHGPFLESTDYPDSSSTRLIPQTLLTADGSDSHKRTAYLKATTRPYTQIRV